MDSEQDIFMKEFKRFRQFDSKLDEFKSSTINIDEPNLEYLKPKQLNINLDETLVKKYGLKDLKDWKCYDLVDVPGLILIENPFQNGFQRYFIKKCLSEYHNLPNKTNLDLHMKREYNLWQNAINKKDMSEFNKLRWTNIGYYYDWTTKVYDLNDFNEIPIDLKNLCILIANALNFNEYKPEAGIINYYHLNSTLSAHQDVAEYNMKAPLISISFGSSAIFLIGSNNKHTKPKAIIINSGDLVIMSNESRAAFHAVPKIFKASNLENYLNYANSEEAAKNRHTFVDDYEWRDYFDYIKINRINLNIRQVFD